MLRDTPIEGAKKKAEGLIDFTLSKKISELKSHYPALIIGSGYGGSVAAARLSQAGMGVCVLEKGREIPVGQFPRTPSEILKSSRFEFKGRAFGPPEGLYRFNGEGEYFFGVATGLGGGSLINSAVMDRPDARVFLDEVWPKAFRDDLSHGVERGYQRSRQVLSPNLYPKMRDTFGRIKKDLKLKLKPAELTIYLQDGLNDQGAATQACIGCGQCNAGCNQGAKGTLVHNYLAQAVRDGTSIFTEIDVQWIEQVGPKWIVYFHSRSLKNTLSRTSPLWVSTDLLILSAGVLGSTEILLRSKQKGLRLSHQLGLRVSRNGSKMGFSYDTKEKRSSYDGGLSKSGLSLGQRASQDPIQTSTESCSDSVLENSPSSNLMMDALGPGITSTLDLRNTENLDEGLILQDGIPPSWSHELLSWLLPYYSKKKQIPGDGLKILEKSLRKERLSRTQNLLVVGHDDASGKVTLREDQALFEWTQSPLFTENTNTHKNLNLINEYLGGQPVELPFSVSVHPLGGCSMGESAEIGVVSHTGQVFSSAQGSEVYPHLYVMDGSVMPRSLGVNPFWTIAALAERSCEMLLGSLSQQRTVDSARLGWGQVDPVKCDGTEEGREERACRAYPQGGGQMAWHAEGSHGQGNLQTQGAHFKAQSLPRQIRFTETLRGYLSSSETLDPRRGEALGRREAEVVMSLTFFIEDGWSSTLSATLSGLALIPGLSQSSLRVQDGHARFFMKRDDAVNAAQLINEAQLWDQDGNCYYLYGWKDFCSRSGSIRELFEDTTQMNVTLYRGRNREAPVLATGRLRVRSWDALKMWVNAQVPEAPSRVSEVRTKGRFILNWMSQLKNTYSKTLAQETRLSLDQFRSARRPLRAPSRQDFSVRTADGVELQLIRYRGGGGTPVLLLHGYSATEYCFTFDTVDTNLVEFLTQHGYDVWVGCWRSNGLLSSARQAFSLDQVAQYDYPAMLSEIKRMTGQTQVDVIAHCVGSHTLLMSLLGGWVKGRVRSVLASQVGVFWDAPALLSFKAKTGLPYLFDSLGIPCIPVTCWVDDPSYLRALDRILHLHPVERNVVCTNPTCRRASFLFGQVFNHEQLNRDTHNLLGMQFGFSSVHAFRQLATIVRKGEAVTWEGQPYLNQDLDALKIPMSFFSGSENRFIGRGSTLRTYELLKRRYGSEQYRYSILEGYGHGDVLIGKNAAVEIFPQFLEHLKWVNSLSG